MKRIIAVLLVLTLLGATLTGCSKKGFDKIIVVGASTTPHAIILEQARAAVEAAGYELKIIEFVDYVQPNVALQSDELDANYFQHSPYMEQFNVDSKGTLAAAAVIHYEPYGIYSKSISSFEELADGAKVAVPNDATNEARALLLLEAEGLITLKEGAGLNATKKDVAENPKNLDIIEIEAAQIVRSLEDVDIAVINGNYAIEAGYNVATDAIASEGKDSLAAETYGNIIAVKEGNEDREDIKVLIDALKSDEVKQFINDTYEGAVVPKF